MKAKKIVALVMSAAMVVGAASMFAACNKDKDKDKDKDKPTPIIPDPVETFENDTNTYYVVGTGKGTLKDASWSSTDTSIPFTKDTTVTDANVFTLELTMYAGDAFKILHEDNWHSAVHYYNLTGDNYTTYFSTNGDKNIICQPGQDGVYLFTLTTDLSKPEQDDNGQSERYTLTVEQTDTVQVPYDMEVTGGITAKNMTNKDGVWTADVSILNRHLTIDEDKEDAETSGKDAKYAAVYVHNKGVGSTAGEALDLYDVDYEHAEVVIDGENTTANLLEAGMYTITFKEEDGSVTITKINDDWKFVLGTETGSSLTYSGEKGVWSGTLDLEEDTVVKLTNVGEDATDEDIELGTLSAGNWVVEYNPETKEVRKAITAYYIVGDYTNPTWNVTAEGCIKLTATETDEKVWSVEVDWTDMDAEYVIFKIVNGNPVNGYIGDNGKWYGHWQDSQGTTGDNDGDNFKLATGKKYIISIDMNNYGKISYEVVEDTPAPAPVE